MRGNEPELIKRAKSGEPEAFGKLYDTHVSAIYRFVLLRVQRKPDAEDITQQVFLKALEGLDRYEMRESIPFSSWLYRIARNTVIDYYRTSRDHVDIELVSEKQFAEDLELGKKVDDSIQFETVVKALDRLTEDEQNIVILRFIEGFSNKEVADTLEKSDGAVRVAQHRALKKIKRHLEEKI